MKSEVSCADKYYQWLPPHVKKVPSIAVLKMDFASAKMKKKRLNRPEAVLPKKEVRAKAPPPTKEEWDGFFDSLIEVGIRPAVAATHPRYCDLYIPKVSKGSASCLQEFYGPNTLNFTWEQLM